MKLKMGMLSGYGTYAGAGGFAVAAIAAFLFGVPMMGEQPMELGALVLAIIAAFVAVRMRMATQKAEDAAKAAADAPKVPPMRIPVWVELRPYGERGIQDMMDDIEIGVAGAASRIERLDLFEESLFKLAE